MNMENLILNQSVTHILLKCAFSPSLLGFDYIREVVEKCCKKENGYQNFITEIYKEVAESDNSTADKVDKRIRASLKDAKSRKGFLAMNEYFDERVYNGERDIPAQEAISILVEISKLEFAKRNTINAKDLQNAGNAC